MLSSLFPVLVHFINFVLLLGVKHQETMGLGRVARLLLWSQCYEPN